MGNLRGRAGSNGKVFMPFVFRLALRLEQVTWAEAMASASEAVFVLRSAQRLFKLDAACCNFDTWLEAEAIGVGIARDECGRVSARQGPPAALAAPAEAVKAEAIARSVEITRRLALDEGSGAAPVACITIGATLIDRLSDPETRSRIVAALENGGAAGHDAGLVEYAHQLVIAVAKAHLEAGATALILLQEEESPDLADIAGFAPVFNLAAYHDVPIIFMSRHPLSERGIARLRAVGGTLYVTPQSCGGGSEALPEHGADHSETPGAWLCTSRWELDPATDPDTVHAWRRRVLCT